MARPKSVILTPAEKKTAIAELKGKLKAATDAVKAAGVVRKDADKAYAAATKTHVNALKENDKITAAAQKTVDGLNAQLQALTAPAPVAA